MNTLKHVILLCFLFCFSNLSLSQVGPGGIGNLDGSDGQPELKVWLMPDSLSLSDGNDVLSWTDHSGNNYDFSAQSSTSPIFRSNGLNGHDYVEFSKSNNRIVRNPFDMPTDAVAVFMVLRTSDNGDGLVSYAVPSSNNEYLFYKSGDHNSYISGNNTDLNVGYNDGSWKIFAHQWRNSDGRLYLHIDGTEEASTTHQSGTSLISNGSLAIGGEQDAVDGGYTAGQDFDGDIAELIMYGSSLKQAERVVIENYLAEKYNLNGNLATDRYIPDDATYIIKLSGVGRESDGTNKLCSDGFVVTENGNFDIGDYIFAAYDGSANSINSAPSVVHGEIQSAWNRNWYLDKSGTAVDAKIAFDFSEGINGDYPANIGNYRLLYKANLGDSYDTISTDGRGVQNGDQIYFAVSDASFSDGYYTLGTVDETNSPLDGLPARTWYTLISGDWESWETWTLDPSGALPDNPSQEIPSDDPIDRVVILSGRTVTVNSNNITNAYLKVDGEIDLQNTTGHSFNEIDGSGRILLAADNFPSGDAAHFVTPGQGEGTVVYYGSGYNLNQSLPFFDLNITLDNPTDKLTLLADYDIAGDFLIDTGEFQINDNSSTTNLNVEVQGNVSVNPAGKILTGTGNARHQFDFYGDLIVDGILEFTNRTSANYTSEATDGIVDANFLNDNEDQLIFCDNTANFYRIEIDKGVDDTYELAIEASDPSYFNLFGFANDSHGSTAQLTENDNALGLIKGTVRLSNNVDVPVLNNSGNYNVSEAARLWIDDGSAAKNSGTAIVPYGKIRVTNGTLEAKVNSGITTRENGLVKVEGGTLNINQLRTSVLGVENVGGYVQSGGTTNILGNNTNGDYYCFNLTYGGNVFNMSGGTLHIHEARGKGGVFIASDAINQNVTGGTVIFDIQNSSNFNITSKAPFYNAIIRNTSGGNDEHRLVGGTDVGSTNEDLAAQPLVVLNDLTIESNAQFETEGLDVHIGRNFTIEDDALYEFHDNTTVFDGTNSGTLSIGDITNLSNPSYTDPEGADPYSSWEHPFYNFTIDKPTDSVLTLQTGCTYDAGNTGAVDDGSGCKNIHDWRSNLVKVTGTFVLESGRFDIDEFSVRLYGDITNKGVFATDASPRNALVKTRKESSPGTRVVNTTDNSEFGNLRLNVGAGIIEFTSDVYVKRLEYKHGRLNIGTHNLKIDTLVMALNGSEVTNNDFSVNDMIIMAGNASDGGLSLYVPEANNPGLADPEAGNPSFNPTVYFFPIGTGTTGSYPGSRYTPANIRLNTMSDDGYITVNISANQLQTTGPHPLGNDVLNKFFRIRHEDFSTVPKVERFRLHFTEADIPDGTNDSEMVDDGSQTWNPGYVLDADPYTRTYEINDGAAASSGFQDNGAEDISVFFWGNEGSGNPGGGFDLINANYTAGRSFKFIGSPTVFYSRRDDGASQFQNYSWNNGNTWSTDPVNKHYGAAAGSYPGAGDVAIIGYGNISQPGASSDCDCWTHRISTNGNREVASLVFNSEATATAKNVRLARITMGSNDDLIAGNIEGTGELHVLISGSNISTITTQDIGDFVNNSQSSFIYNFSGAPSSNPFIIDQFTEYPTVRFYSNSVNDSDNKQYRSTFGSDVTAKMMLLDGNSAFELTNDLTITDTLFIGANRDGEFIFNNGATSNTLTANEVLFESPLFGSGNQSENRNKIWVDTLGGNGVEHKLIVEGNITMRTGSSQPDNGAAFDLYTTSSDNNVVLELSGENNASFHNSTNALPEFYRVVMNKGDDQTYEFTFNDAFSLKGISNGEIDEKALVMEKGTLVLNNSAINIDVNSGSSSAADFYLPQTAGLTINAGYVSISASGGESGFILDGKLTINGGTVDLTGDGSSDNYIRYSASGNANIEISAGKLNVGSQIRRGLTSSEGILVYNQSGGEVVIGKNSAPENSRGVFEILNSGSQFIHTGGDLILARGQSNPIAASLLMKPAFANIASGTRITFGYEGDTPEDIQWTDVSSDLTITGNDMQRTTGDGWADDGAGAASQQKITEGGYVEASTGETNTGKLFGLSSTNTNNHYNTIEFGINLNAGGKINLYESGAKITTWNGTGSPDAVDYLPGDVLKVAVQGGEVKYYHNETLLHTSTTTPSLPLIADLSVNHNGATLNDVTILTGNASPITGEDFTIYAETDLRDVELGSLAEPTVRMVIGSLTMDSLIIGNNATYNANGLDLILHGNFISDGDFVPGENTTIMDAVGNQAIYGAATFYNFTRSNNGNLDIENDVCVDNIFDMSNGIFNDNDHTLTVKGNIHFGGTHSWGGSSQGIFLNGTSEQIMTGAGTYGLLTIDNRSGVSIDPGSGSGISINDSLKLNDGIFDIDQYLLLIEENAEITTSGTFDANTMIQTNISFTDAGIVKDFPAISSTKDYIFPVGSEGKYTPIAFSVDAVDAGGSIRLKAANEMQPTINDDSDECDEFDDTQNVLHYHWILESTNINNFTANATFTYYPSDALFDNPHGYDLTDYIAARILTYGDNTWNKYDETYVDEGNNQLVFDFVSTNDDGISGDYTAGIEQGPGCNGAIPNEVTEYITLGSGDWNDANNWATYDSETSTTGSPGVGVPASGPRGAIVFVDAGHTLAVPDNYISAYKTRIESGATLDIGTTFGHRLGIVTGTGTLYLENGALPAGIYDSLFAAGGGTLHFGGTTIYQISNINQVNNLRFTGNNWKFFPNNDITILGDITIDGGYPYQKENRTVYLEGDLVFNSGRFRFGLYRNTFVFSGSEDQQITGEFIENPNKSFHTLSVNKPGGSLTLNDNVLVVDELSLDQGLVNSSSGGQFRLETSTSLINYSSNSYINGPLYKDLNSSSDFTFPLGKAGYYRPLEVKDPTARAQWIAEYFPSNGTSAMESSLAQVSPDDRWVVEDVNNVHPNAKVTLHWGEETNVEDGYLDELRVAYLDGGTWRDAGNSAYGGNSLDGYVTSNAVSFSTKEFTVASSTDNNPLPVTLLEFDAVAENNKVNITWQTANERDNDYFVIERSRDGVIFNEVARVNGAGNSSTPLSYQTTDHDPYTGISYYRLKQVDYDGAEKVYPMVVVEITGITLEEPRLNIHPNPYREGEIIADIGGFNTESHALVMLADISGNALWQSRMKPTREGLSEELGRELSSVQPGFYLVIVVSQDRKASARIVKK